MPEGQNNHLKEVIIGLFVTVFGGILVVQYQEWLKGGKGPEPKSTETNLSNNEAEKSKTFPKGGIDAGAASVPINSTESQAEGNNIPKSTMPKHQNRLELETDEYLFAIDECKRQGENIQIYLTVISKGKDRNLGVATRGQQGATKIYDNNNSEYIINKVKIANNSSREGGGSINQIIIRDVPTKVVLMFNDVNTTANSISLLDIGCYYDFAPLKFRNVPIGYKSEIEKYITPETVQNQNNLKYDNDDYTFVIDECSRQGENLQIKLTATSKGKDRNLGIATVGQQDATTIFDNFNNQYVVQQIKIANETSRYGGGSINRILIKNVPTSINLFFADVNSEAKSISLLRIGCYYDFDPIQFRKLKIN